MTTYYDHDRIGRTKTPDRRLFRTVRLVACLAAGALIVGVHGAGPAMAASGVQLFDINPDVSNNSDPDATTGGRVNGVDIVPGDNNTVYAASEFGGVFKSTDGGSTWSRLDGHLPTVTRDVAVDPSFVSRVYATSLFDGRVTPLSGIEVSTDAGATWVHPATANPPALFPCDNALNQLGAHGIGIRPDAPANVFIGTTCGVARTTNAGVTWTFVDVVTPSGSADTVWDVVVQPGGPNGLGIIDTCGDDRHRRSVDGGVTWTGGSALLPAGSCSIAASPDESYVLFVYASDNNIYESDDAGATWTNRGTPDLRRQGREQFVVTNQRSGATFDLWAGDVNLFRGTCTTPAVPAIGGANRCPVAATGAIPSPWVLPAGWAGPFTRDGTCCPVPITNKAHDDAGDLEFDTTVATDACPRVFSSDGGMHSNVLAVLGSPICQSPSLERTNVGLHALWLWSQDSARVAGALTEDLYFGVQDDGSFGATNGGALPPTWNNANCCDIFDMSAQTGRVVYDTCCNMGVSTIRLGTPGLAASAAIAPNPPGTLPQFQFPDFIDDFGDKQYAAATTGAGGGLYLTNDITAGVVVWTQLGAATTPAGGFCAVYAAVTGGAPTFYAQNGACNITSGDQIWKFVGTGAGSWTRVDNTTGVPGGFRLFAVDEGNPNRLLAATGAGFTFRSNNAGASWTPMPQLDALVTGSGLFLQRVPTLLSLDPEDSNVLVAGGRDSGVFVSTNDGATWSLVTDPINSDTSGVPHLPRPLFANYDHDVPGTVRVYLGTQGRGVWRLDLQSVDLSITKTCEPDPVNAGEQLVCTIVVTNEGGLDATDVVITDDLPPEVTYIADSDACTLFPGGGAGGLDRLECRVGTIAAGDSVTFQIKTHVNVDAIVATGPIFITNTACVSSAEPDEDPDDNCTTEDTLVEDLADLRVIKLSKPDDAVRAGDLFTYTIYVDNLGPSSARGVFFTDDIISDGKFSILNILSDPLRTDTCNPAAPVPPPGSGQVVKCTLQEPLEPVGSDPDGDGVPNSGRWRVQIEARANQTHDIDNVVVVATGPGIWVWPAGNVTWTSGTPDPDMSNNTAIDAISIIDTSNLSVVKTAEGEEQQIGRQGLIFNNAIFGQPFPTSPNYFVSTRVTAGRRIHYSVQVTNSGPSIAENVVMKDRLPAGVRYYQGSLIVEKSVPNGLVTVLPAPCDTGTPGEPLDKMVCGLGTLAVGQSAFINFQVITDASLAAGTVLENDATVSSDEFDPINTNNYSFVHNTVLTAGDLSVAKSAVGEVVTGYDATLRRHQIGELSNQVTAGLVLRYQIQVQNNGPSDSLNVTIQEDLPVPVLIPALPTEAVTFIDADGASCRPSTLDQQRIFCTVGNLAAGARRTFDIYVRVNSAVPNATLLLNTVTALHSGSNVLPPGPPPAIPGLEPIRPLTWDPCTSGCLDVVGSPLPNTNVATNTSTVTAVADVFVQYGQLEAPEQGLNAASPTVAGANATEDTANAPIGGRILNRIRDVVTGLLDDAEPVEAASPDQQDSPLIAEAVAGSERRYLITFGNDGPSVARGVGINHLLDFKQAGILGETFQRCEPVDPDDLVTCGPAAGNSVPVTLFRKHNDLIIPSANTGTLNPGEVFQYYLVTRIDPGYVLDANNTGTIPAGWTSKGFFAQNQVTITTTTTDFHTQNNTDRELTLIRALADLQLTKVDDRAGFLNCDPVVPGGTIFYDLTVTNAGPSDAAEVFVIDQLPEDFVAVDPALVTVTVSRGQVVEIRDDGQITVRVGNDPNNLGVNEFGRLNAGSVPVLIHIEVIVRLDALCGGQASNTARVETRRNDVRWPVVPPPFPGLDGGPRTPTADPDLTSNTDTELTTVECPSVEVKKTVSFNGLCPGQNFEDGVFNLPGQPVTFCFEITNTGTTFLDEIFIEDVLDNRQIDPTIIFTDTIASGGDPNLPVAPGETVRRQVTIDQLLAMCACGLNNDSVTVTANPVNSGRTDLPCLPDVTDTDEATIEVPCAGVDFRLQLPVLNANDCESWIQVQNVGNRATKSVLVIWGEPSFCPPQAAGPLKVECSGLLRPGASWSYAAGQIPAGAMSAIAYSLNATDMIRDSEGNLAPFADIACGALFNYIVGDWERWQRFDIAYRTQGTWHGPFDQSGHQTILDFGEHQGEPLAIVVDRQCPDPTDPNVMVNAAYTGVSSDEEGAYDPRAGGYAYYAPLLLADAGGLNSWLWIQNSGIECSSLEIWYRAQDNCLRTLLADVLTLAPGETVHLEPSSVVGPDWQGSAWIRASQPLGVIVDTMGPNHFTSYKGVVADINSLDFSLGTQVNYAPLIYNQQQGWDTAIVTQNLSSTTNAKVKVYFLDQSGDIIGTLVDWICPRGSQIFFLPMIGSLPGNWVGSARVESQEWWSPGDPLVDPPRVQSVVLLEKWDDPARTMRREAVAYNASTECTTLDWQLGHGDGSDGSAVLALPMLAKENRGITTEIAITNLVAKPGFTDFAVFIYDQNGLLDWVCEKLNEKQVEYIDLATWGYISPRWLGSGVISATFWEHDVFDAHGVFLRNIVGLASVAVERVGGTRGGADVPGDESKAYEAFPVFDFFINEGHINCPGVP